MRAPRRNPARASVSPRHPAPPTDRVAGHIRRLIEGDALVGELLSQFPGAQIVAGWKAVSVPWWGREVTFVEGESEDGGRTFRNEIGRAHV